MPERPPERPPDELEVPEQDYLDPETAAADDTIDDQESYLEERDGS